MRVIQVPEDLIGRKIDKNQKMDFHVLDLGYILRAYFTGFLVLGVKDAQSSVSLTLAKKTDKGPITVLLQVFNYVHAIIGMVEFPNLEKEDVKDLHPEFAKFLKSFDKALFKRLNKDKQYMVVSQNVRSRTHYTAACAFTFSELKSNKKEPTEEKC